MFGEAKSVIPVLGGTERIFDSTLDQFKCEADLLHSFQINLCSFEVILDVCEARKLSAFHTTNSF